MNRKEFLLKLEEIFSKDLSEGLVGAYKYILTDPDGTEINYSELYKLLANEYKFPAAPMPAWFAERLPRVRKYRGEQESALDKALREGSAKIIRDEPEKQRRLIQLPNGNFDYFYYGIVEDETSIA